jgi:hypothetical protein
MIAAVVLAVTFVAGPLAGVVVLMRLAIHREQRQGRLRVVAPTRLTAGARMVSGLHVRVAASKPLGVQQRTSRPEASAEAVKQGLSRQSQSGSGKVRKASGG